LSDIIKRISSIEAEDKHIGAALGLNLRPLGNDETDDDNTLDAAEKKSKAPKPLGLTPIEDDVLDLTDLSLDPEIDLESPISLSEKDTPLMMRPTSETIAEPIPSVPPPAAPSPKLPPENKLPDFLEIEKEPLPEALIAADVQGGLSSAYNADADISPSAVPPVSTALSPSAALAITPSLAAAGDVDAPAPKTTFILTLGVIAALLWIMCSALVVFDIFGAADSRPTLNNIQKLAFAVIIAAPLLLIAVTTFAFRQLGRLNQKAAILQTAATAMLTPDDSVIARSTIMAKSIQAQVDDVNMKVSSALNRMELLDDMVKSQSSSLAKSTIAIETTTNSAEGRLTSQRESLENIATLFESRMAQLSDMLEGHTQQLYQSGQKAEQRVQEARVSVENAAEKISGASETVRQNAVAAAQTLSGSQLEITQLGEAVQNQSIQLDSVYRQHLRDLQLMLTELRNQQDELGATMEERLSKMRDMSLSAKVGAESLTEASIKGRETVEALNQAASLTDTAVRARFSEMEEMVKYSTQRAESISDTAARQVQNSLSSTRKEIARIETDMLDLMDKLNRSQSVEFEAPRLQPPQLLSQEASPATQDTARPKLRLRPASTSDGTTETAPQSQHSAAGPALADIAPPTKTPDAPSPGKGLFDGSEASRHSLYTPSADTELEMHMPDDADMPDELRRPAAQSTEESKSRWNWKGIFPTADKVKPDPYASVSDVSIIQSLTTLGLSPSAIVDDGCIIEAANLRKVKGALAMSEAITKRLGEPVRHLFQATERDASLKTDIRAFTDQFNARLSPIENDREAIRAKLESEAGRAYLLCDAALNG
jgi:hypothetical protein